jgi:integrase
VFVTITARNDLIARGKLKGRPTGPSALQRMRAMLRSCLNDAKREELITSNPAELVKLPSGKAPSAKVWTTPRERAWRAEVQALIEQGKSAKVARHDASVPSSVMVWTATHLGRFLNAVAEDRLYALWFFVGTRGLRRGELLGLRWGDIDWDAATVTFERQLVNVPGEVMEDKPKSDAGGRVIALGGEGVTVLKAHRAR